MSPAQQVNFDEPLPLAVVLDSDFVINLLHENEEFHEHGDQYLRTFLDLFDRYEVRIGTRLLDRALQLMARYNLKSHDACVAAIAFHTDVADVVSLDKDFLRVDGLRVWNNGIPARRAGRRR